MRIFSPLLYAYSTLKLILCAVLTGVICFLSFTGTSQSNTNKNQIELCFFCEQPSNGTYSLHSVHTFRLGKGILRKQLLNNCNLPAKLQQDYTRCNVS